MTYKNYDRETYLNSFKEIMKLKPQVENILTMHLKKVWIIWLWPEWEAVFPS